MIKKEEFFFTEFDDFIINDFMLKEERAQKTINLFKISTKNFIEN